MHLRLDVVSYGVGKDLNRDPGSCAATIFDRNLLRTE